MGHHSSFLDPASHTKALTKASKCDGGSSPEDSMLVDALQSPGDRLSSPCFAAAGQGDHDNASAKDESFDDFLPHHLTNVRASSKMMLLGLLDQVRGVKGPSEVPTDVDSQLKLLTLSAAWM